MYTLNAFNQRLDQHSFSHVIKVEQICDQTSPDTIRPPSSDKTLKRRRFCPESIEMKIAFTRFMSYHHTDIEDNSSSIMKILRRLLDNLLHIATG